jgi:hypothetical protein
MLPGQQAINAPTKQHCVNHFKELNFIFLKKYIHGITESSPQVMILWKVQ